MNKVHYFESWSLDEFNKINRRQEDICEEIKEINVTLDTIQRTLFDIKCDTQVHNYFVAEYAYVSLSMLTPL
jgi:hypothetical protein